MNDRPIVLEIPASSAYLSLARSATTAVCAVSEGVGLLLKDAAAGSRVRISLTPWRDRQLIGVDIDISAQSASDRAPRPTTFSWTVLASLVNNVSAEIADSIVTLRLRSRQEAIAP